MNINRNTGKIIFDSGSLGATLSQSEFLSASFAKKAKIVVANAPWTTFKLWFAPNIIGNIIFNGDKLSEVRLLMMHDTEENWTRESELDRKECHDKWLFLNFGHPPYHYHWGTIESTFDPRSICSQIIVRYICTATNSHRRANF
jgi:hypothetical protein